MNLKEMLKVLSTKSCPPEELRGSCSEYAECSDCGNRVFAKLLETLDREYVPKEEPDSLEKIEQDAEKPYVAYWKCPGFGLCEGCPAKIDGAKPWQRYGAKDCVIAQRLDLLHRQRKLLEGKE